MKRCKCCLDELPLGGYVCQKPACREWWIAPNAYHQFSMKAINEAWDNHVMPNLGGDWKNPIDIVVPYTQQTVVFASIMFFTATIPEVGEPFVTRVTKSGIVRQSVRITAAGYRNGPAN